MLRIEHISKKFASLQALHNVNLTVHRVQIMGLIGKNGAEKTTTFHRILNFIHYKGLITWEDQSIKETILYAIGYSPEERSLMPQMNVEQQIIYLVKLKNVTL